MLETLSRLQQLESLTLESTPAVFEPRGGQRATGYAGVTISRASIAIRFAASEKLTVEKAPYGESNGSIVAVDGAWSAKDVNDAGVAADGERLFRTMALKIGSADGNEVAATRLVIAGGAWQGEGSLNGSRVIVQPLSKDAVSHHELRASITVERDLDEATIEAMGRATGFICGLDVEILRVERYSAQGVLLQVEHRRGYRRVGRGPHSPFTGVADEHRMRAWIALVAAMPGLLKSGVPIDMIIDEIGAHNQVSQINVSAQLLLLATVTAAHQRLHGSEVGPPALSRRQELARLDRDLGLGLKDEDFERYDRLRVELLDAGYFHAPGYETGRPQMDIKFLRDIAYVTVLRLCGYAGPFYGAERFTVRELASAPSA